MKRILLTGSSGQIGTELTLELIKRYGGENVLATDLKKPKVNYNFEELDVLDNNKLSTLIKKFQPDAVFHLAAILSATGEANPTLAWDININGMMNVFNVCHAEKVEKVFIPSSIAVFGKYIQQEDTPQNSVLKPTTMYGLTKVTGELLCDYYRSKYGLDARGLRYPGIISSETLPGGGTTDYAVEIFYEAIKHQKYNCFLKADTKLPMMYMPDCINATIDLMEADKNKLTYSGDYNLAAVSFTAEELANEIRKYIPNFEITYNPDHRQKIADSWPFSIDDSPARKDWNWNHKFGLEEMTKDMIEKLTAKHEQGQF